MIKVPVIMYHAVCPDNKDWIWRHLITPLDVFENQIKTLAKRAYSPITLHELYNYVKYNNKIPEKSIVLTFDDGYLDNWVYAFPILNKYKMKGTVFVNPEFADPINECRPNLEDVWNGRYREDELFSKGFLSWPEMRKMEEAGIMDIQSHSMSHTWYFTGDQIVDFHHPGCNQYPWLFWNNRPERKCYYLSENQEFFVPYGTPIYEHGRSLGVRRYFEDKSLNNYLANFVRKQGIGFFNDKGWKDILFQQVEVYTAKNKLRGTYETEEEQLARYRYELIESRKILEEKLGKKVQHLCWAGGAFNNMALAIAEEAGYLSSTLFYNDRKRKNAFGDNPSEINRTGCVAEFRWHDIYITYTGPGYFMANIKYFCGDTIYLWVIRLYKMGYLIRYFLGKLLKGGELQ